MALLRSVDATSHILPILPCKVLALYAAPHVGMDAAFKITEDLLIKENLLTYMDAQALARGDLINRANGFFRNRVSEDGVISFGGDHCAFQIIGDGLGSAAIPPKVSIMLLPRKYHSSRTIYNVAVSISKGNRRHFKSELLNCL